MTRSGGWFLQLPFFLPAARSPQPAARSPQPAARSPRLELAVGSWRRPIVGDLIDD